MIFLDFETYYDKDYDLNHQSIMSYCRDSRFKILGCAAAEDGGEITWFTNMEALKEFVGSSPIVAHNAKFDGFILRNNLRQWSRQYIDTKGMAQAVLGNRVSGFSLRELANYYVLPPKMDMEKDDLAAYCKHDVWLCRELYTKLAPFFPTSQLIFLDWTVRTFVEPKLVLNTTLLEQAQTQEVNIRQASLDQSGIAREVFASNDKFSALLASKGYTVPMKRSKRTGKTIPALSLGDPEFIALGCTTDPVLKQLIEARKLAKSNLLPTRLNKLAALSKTGSWSFDVEFSGAKQTHRFSGGSGAGGNPQNFTRGSALRAAVEAPEGFSLIVSDFSSIEMRIVAYLANSIGLTSVIEQNGDVYCDFASAFFGRKITKDDKEERRFGKTAILGLGYGMGAVKFHDSVFLQTGKDISKEAAKKAVSLYRHRYWQIPALWNRLNDVIPFIAGEKNGTVGLSNIPVTFSQGEIILPSGLALKYPNLRREGDEWIFDTNELKTSKTVQKLYGGKLLENITQALAGEICKEAMLPFLEDCTGMVHDEIHLLVPDAAAHDAAIALNLAMSQAPSWMPKLHLAAETHIGKNWGDAK